MLPLSIANSLFIYSLETELLQGPSSWKTKSEPPLVTPLEWERVESMYDPLSSFETFNLIQS